MLRRFTGCCRDSVGDALGIQELHKKRHCNFSRLPLKSSRDLRERPMIYGHQIARVTAIGCGIGLLSGMLFGKNPLPEAFSVPGHSIREVCVALWAFSLPLWFSIEEYWAPPSDPELDLFRKSQQLGRQIWTGLGGAAAIIIGLAPAPPSPPARG